MLLRELASSHIENATLTRRCTAEAASHTHLFDHLPIAAIETDATGLILAANRAAGLLLNVSTRYLANRVLMHFAEDRAAFITLLNALPMAQSERGQVLRLRPRERAPLNITATILPSAPHEPSTWVWFLSPVLLKDTAVPRPDFQSTGIET